MPLLRRKFPSAACGADAQNTMPKQEIRWTWSRKLSEQEVNELKMINSLDLEPAGAAGKERVDWKKWRGDRFLDLDYENMKKGLKDWHKCQGGGGEGNG